MKWNDLAGSFGLTAAFAAVMLFAGSPAAREAVPHSPQAPPIVGATAPVETAPRADTSSVAIVPDECDDLSASSETFLVADDAASLTENATAQGAACKPCKDRTWCKCTYNGMARSSCNPCCYRNNIGVLTCLD